MQSKVHLDVKSSAYPVDRKQDNFGFYCQYINI